MKCFTDMGTLESALADLEQPTNQEIAHRQHDERLCRQHQIIQTRIQQPVPVGLGQLRSDLIDLLRYLSRNFFLRHASGRSARTALMASCIFDVLPLETALLRLLYAAETVESSRSA